MKKNINLKDFNTFGIEVFASEFVELNSSKDAFAFFKSTDLNGKEFLILGGGSNLLLTEDFRGMVIKNNLKGIEVIKENDDSIVLKAGAGENWHEFVLQCIDKGYAGLENLSLIPGNVGASPMQNIGAYGVEVKDLITGVEAIELSTGKVKIFTNEECRFDYRSSIFKTTSKNQYFISSVNFKLSKKPDFNVSYGAIKSQLDQNGIPQESLTIKAISDAVIAIRESKLPDPKKIGNSGSFFKNPIVSAAEFEQLKRKFKSIPAYQLPNGDYKLAAGWLIEKTGWKGYTEGNYGVHKNQALVLVNYGGASGLEIYDLSERILLSVKDKFRVKLEREVNIL
ncbi:UDP-N-acetylmuramate dehydrogenase [Vicingaceae bacterium]|nr:UDP-N-acetylmuramate dehydrogenase [Vicingaceae bacterium]MDB4061046.1 UDP-N-acetylmuramate dehydrogenase [Vicingaceae bacterium]MDC1451850.1 UDP-N-acetylmuramate dehydrogenase [Vicingaceae bacterium]